MRKKDYNSIIFTLFFLLGFVGNCIFAQEANVSSEIKSSEESAVSTSENITVKSSFKRISHYSKKAANPQKKYIIIWCDGLLNVDRLYSRTSICRILDKCMNCGVDAIAVPAKLQLGFTTYNSNWCKKISTVPTSSVTIPSNFDLIKIVTEEAHKRDIDVLAVFEIFCGGDKSLGVGHYYEKDADEISVVNDISPFSAEKKSSIQPLSKLKEGELDLSNGILFGNPIHPNVQSRELRIISEVVSQYDIDGIILNKMRYSGLDADFSELSRQEFEGFLGKKVENFPDDIFYVMKDESSNEIRMIEGKYYKEWCKWRSANIKEFLIRIMTRVKIIKTEIPVGCAVGGWYQDYYEVGVNWASELYTPTEKKGAKTAIPDWAEKWYSESYQWTGFAEKINFIMPGLHFNYFTEADAERAGQSKWSSVEGGCKMAKEVTKGFLPIFTSIDVSLYNNNKEAISEAIISALKYSNGIKLYDLAFIEEQNLWSVIIEALKKSR